MALRLAPYLLLAAVALGVFYLLGRWEADMDSKFAQWSADVDRQLGEVREAYQRRQQELGDSIALVESRADSIEAAADRRAESLAHEVASTRALLRDAQADDADAATVRLALRFADSTIVALEAELEARQQLTIELRGLVALERQRADNAEARIGILEGLLEEGQKVSQCRIAGFIPCPSRGLVAVVAFVGGAFSYAVLGP